MTIICLGFSFFTVTDFDGDAVGMQVEEEQVEKEEATEVWLYFSRLCLWLSKIL